MKRKLPNIILMVLDTVGAKHLSFYGYPRPTSPNLEKIAQECLVYSRCFAPACWTVPSHASIFTGLYPSQHGAFEGRFILRDNLSHLVPILKAQGYATYGISANSLVSPASGLCRGFDEFYDLGFRDVSRLKAEFQGSGETQAKRGGHTAWVQTAMSPRDMLTKMLHYLWKTGQAGEVLKISIGMVTRQAQRWLKPSPIDNATPYTRKTVALIRDILKRRASADSPFFLFVNILQAHQNYCPPFRWRRFSGWHDRTAVSPQKFYHQSASPALARLVGKYGNLYDDEILYLDAVIGRIWEMFRSASMFEDTVVLITSDHGEHFGEKGHYTHILSLYNELLWVPLLIRFPRNLASPGLDRRLVSLNDLYVTILDLVESPMPHPDTSYSLLAPPQRELAIAQCIDPDMWQTYLRSKQKSQGNFSPPVFAAVTQNNLKLIEQRDGVLEVYDLQESLIEGQDLAPTLSPGVLRDYRNLLTELKHETGFYEAQAELGGHANQRVA